MHSTQSQEPSKEAGKGGPGTSDGGGPAGRSGPHLEFPGRIISPGVAFGYAHLEEPLPSAYKLSVDPGAVQEEVARLERAVARVQRRLEEYLKEFASHDESDLQKILATQALMLEDPVFHAAMVRRIEDRLSSAERAVDEEFSVVVERLDSSPDHYLRARSEDVRGICHLLKKALHLGKAAFGPTDRAKRIPIFFSANLRPTAVLRARRAGAVAFLTSSTAFTSHAAILLRASGMPALGDEAISSAPIEEGMPLLVDAIQGVLHVNPTEAVRREARRLRKQLEDVGSLSTLPALEARTADGTRIDLWGNIDHPSQALSCLHNRLCGVGLFRTEFMVLDTGRIPSEEEQYLAYRKVIEPLKGRPVIVRSFDIGGDKITTGLHDCVGRNPALGICGIRRHLLRRPKELRAQVRAILRASQGAAVSILLPMVTHVGDVIGARAHIDVARAELEAAGVPHNPDVRVGAMVEIPSAALNVGAILSHVDFVSIGTNDLLQYLTASDRDNPDVVAYQELESSGFQTLLGHIMNQARALGREKDVYVCGEMASDPDGAKLLVRMGVTSLSVTPGSAAEVRRAIETLDLVACGPGDE